MTRTIQTQPTSVELGTIVRRFAPAAFLILVWLLFFGRLMFDRLPISGDMTLFYAPFYSLRWDDGLPLWNPHLAAGLPMDANFQFSAAYPLRWPFYFLADWRDYFGIYMALHYLIAMAGSYGTLRAMRMCRAAALAGAVVFACGGYMMGRIINSTIFLSSCWFPYLVWGAVDRRPRGWLVTSAAVAMVLLTGSPHVMAYGTAGFAIAWLVMFPRASTDGERPGPENGGRRVWAAAWLFFALGVVIGGVNLWPGLIEVGDTIRENTDVSNNLEDSLRWGEIPYSILGGGGSVVQPEKNDYTLYQCGAGLLLILLAATRRETWRDPRWALGVALTLAGFFFALGDRIGWQYVIDKIPGLRLLEGPARALVLTAFGLATLTAYGMDALLLSGVRRRLAISAAGALAAAAMVTYLGLNWPRNVDVSAAFRGWAVRPGLAVGQWFTFINTPMTLLPAAAALALGRKAGPRLAFVFLALITLQLRHFEPRVQPQTVHRSAFDAPPNIQFLRERAARETPFRIACFDALRFHHTQMDSIHKRAFLMANLATTYGLEDISAFDPLISRRYKNLFKGVGEPVFNDPIRTVDFARPDADLFRRLNARYLIGHPNDRRLTSVPESLIASDPVAEVQAWEEAGVTMSVEAWSFVSLVDGTRDLKPGEEIARLTVDAEEGTFSWPIRYGRETAHVTAGKNEIKDLPVAQNMVWWRYPFEFMSDFRIRQSNFRSTIPFGRPLRVRRVRWILSHPGVYFLVQAQAYRLAEPLRDWRLAFADPLAPVYELVDTEPRVSLLPLSALKEKGEGSDANDMALISREPAEGRIEIERRSRRRLALKVVSPEPGYIYRRESWGRGWRVRVDGRETPLRRVDAFQAARIPAGEHRIEFHYAAPIYRYASLASLIASALVLGLWLGGRRFVGPVPRGATSAGAV